MNDPIKNQVLALLQHATSRPGGTSELIIMLCRFWLDRRVEEPSPQAEEEKTYLAQLVGIRIACFQLTKVLRSGKKGGTFGCRELDELAEELEGLCAIKKLPN